MIAWSRLCPAVVAPAETAPLRRHYGESIESIVGSGEYYWMSGYMMNYAGPACQKNPDTGKPGCTPAFFPRKVEELDVDAPQVMALVAPRAIMTNGGTAATTPGNGDEWQDPRGMYLTGALSGPVWEVLGWPGQVIPVGTPFTSNPTPFHNGGIDRRHASVRYGVHQRHGGLPASLAGTHGCAGVARLRHLRFEVPERHTSADHRGPDVCAAPELHDCGNRCRERPAVADPSRTVRSKAARALMSLTSTTAPGPSPCRIAASLTVDPASYSLTLMASDGILPAHDTTVTISTPIVNGTIQLLSSATFSKQGDGGWLATITVTNTGTGDSAERGAHRHDRGQHQWSVGTAGAHRDRSGWLCRYHPGVAREHRHLRRPHSCTAHRNLYGRHLWRSLPYNAALIFTGRDTQRHRPLLQQPAGSALSRDIG